MPWTCLTIKEEDFFALSTLENNQRLKLIWPSVFAMPFWLQTWWKHFGAGLKPLILSAWKGTDLVGLAPLMIKDSTAFLLGSADICDYLDFAVLPGEEHDFISCTLTALAERDIDCLDLFAQRPEAVVFKGFFSGKPVEGWQGSMEQENESAEILLPQDWETYLATLNKKQRHEVRRKIRKLENETESVRYDVLEQKEEIVRFIPKFLDLFLQNPEKEEFMTGKMKSFFQESITAAAGSGLARFGLLEVNDQLAAAVLYFDYRHRIYLYNSGYDNDYNDLSVGLLSKIFCIRDSIERGKKVFDFLKGPEIYKSRLGGKNVPIYRVILTGDTK